MTDGSCVAPSDLDLQCSEMLINRQWSHDREQVILCLKKSDHSAAIMMSDCCCQIHPADLVSAQINRLCVLMCSEARGEAATAGTLQCRPSEIVAAPKVKTKQKTCALRAQHAQAAPTTEKITRLLRVGLSIMTLL